MIPEMSEVATVAMNRWLFALYQCVESGRVYVSYGQHAALVQWLVLTKTHSYGVSCSLLEFEILNAMPARIEWDTRRLQQLWRQ